MSSTGVLRARASIIGVWAAGVLSPDLAARGFSGDALYGVAALASLLLWLSIVEGLSRLRVRHARMAGACIALLAIFLPLWVMGTARYAAAEHGDLPPSAVCFFLRNPRYAVVLAGGATPFAHRIALPGSMIALAVFLHLLTRRPIPRPAPLHRQTRKLALAVAIWLMVLPKAARSADLEGLRSTVGGVGLWLTSKPQLGKPDRARPGTSLPRSRPNLVLLLQESLGAQAWAPWNPASTSSPHVSRFLTEESDLAVWFPRATTAAGATAVSLPTILTGLAPDAPRSDFMRAPLLWQEARGLGYRTALFSAEDYDWAYFRTYFLGEEGPDVAKVAADFDGAPRVNDSGVDDRLPAQAATDFIDASENDGRPFLVVVQFNATHRPCWAPGLLPDGETRPIRCAAAAAHVDEASAHILDHLRKVGHLEDTLVFGTADHGESFRDDRPPRLESYFEDVTIVPFYLRLPASLAFLRPGTLAQVRANRTARISNLDIYPTILDVWDRWPLADGDRPRLAGRSLLRPIDPDRSLVVVNTGEIHDFNWSHEGFALYHGRWKWLCDEYHGVRLFDLDEDPGETTNVYPTKHADELTLFQFEVRRHPDLTRILGNIAPDLL